MDASHQQEVAFEIPSTIRVYKNGAVERLRDTDFVPPSTDPTTGVTSKDVTILPDAGVSARLFLPNYVAAAGNKNKNKKLPLLVYFHGGAFCISSPFNEKYNGYLTKLVGEAKVVAVSVNYRLAPEHPLPAAYEDSWAVLKWTTAHSGGNGPEPWLNEYADFGRVFLGGDSAGGNIAHNLGLLAGDPEFGLGPGVGLIGIALVHPYFWGSDPIGSEAADQARKAVVDSLWPFICPSSPDNDDPWINPVASGALGLTRLGCKRVLVCVAEKDVLRDRGWVYYEALGRSGWMGVVEIEDTEGEAHAFHLIDLGSEKAQYLIRRLAAFYNRDMPLL